MPVCVFALVQVLPGENIQVNICSLPVSAAHLLYNVFGGYRDKGSRGKILKRGRIGKGVGPEEIEGEVIEKTLQIGKETCLLSPSF
jgi:hypothetical protein